MAVAKRRRVKLSERLIPCNCCNYPISQRHHLFEVAEYGENDYTRQLCANCHELYHLIDKFSDECDENPNDENHTRSSRLISQIMHVWGEDDPRLTYLFELSNLVRENRAAAFMSFGVFNYFLRDIEEGKYG